MTHGLPLDFFNFFVNNLYIGKDMAMAKKENIPLVLTHKVVISVLIPMLTTEVNQVHIMILWGVHIQMKNWASHTIYVSGSVMGPWRGSLGASFVLADWRVRVFGPSGIIGRPSDRLYVWTFPLYGWMERISRYIHFYSQSQLSIW